MEGAPASCSIGSSQPPLQHCRRCLHDRAQQMGMWYYLSQNEGGGGHRKALQVEFELGINACGQLEPKLGRQQVNAASGV